MSDFFLRTCSETRLGFDIGSPNPFGFPRTPNPKGTFALFCATKCYSYRPYINIDPGGIARFARVLRNENAILTGPTFM